MAHASFPLPFADSPAATARGRRALRTVGLPLFAAGAVLALTVGALVQLADVTTSLDRAVQSREAANRALVTQIADVERARAVSAARADDARALIGQQLAALESRDGFLP